jgi:hypothetical protein
VAEAAKIRCALDLRDVPPSAFRMPDDGRQWRHKCELRCALLHWLATFADADGSNVEAGIKRMETRFEVSRRTIFRRLDDLIELGFTTREKLTGFKGTRRRKINVAAILKKAEVPSSPNPVVPSSPSVVPSTPVSDVPSSQPDVPSSLSVVPPSHPVVPKSAGFGTQPILTVPTDLPSFQTGPNRSGWEGWIGKLPSELDGAVPNKQQREEIEKQVQQHGGEVILAAIHRWVDIRDMPIDGLRSNKWGAWLRECPVHINWAVQEKKAADEKKSLAAATEAYVRQQQREHSEFMNYEAPPKNEGNPEDYFD